jgi:EAL domain-containing protein (putative c-di-GMP-specific phosphodiesterase class I)
MQNDFLEKVFEILSKIKVNTQYISFEMTESILMYSIEKGSSVINQLRNAGISISLDDFGTGYSSLKYFKELPIATLKIDKTFIDQIATNEYDEQLVDTMIQLAHNKKINVIAEGVETQVQLDRLINMDCDMVQGFLFSKPLKETDMLKLSAHSEKTS